MINKRLLAYAKKVKSRLFEAVLLKYLLFAANILFAYLAASAVESVLVRKEGGDVLSGAWVFAAAALLIAVFRFFVSARTASNEFRIAKQVQTEIRDDIYKKIVDLGVGYLDKAGSANLVSIRSKAWRCLRSTSRAICRS